MTASQWFRDAFLIYEAAGDKDRVAHSIVQEIATEPSEAHALAAFLGHLQAALRDTMQEEEPEIAG